LKSCCNWGIVFEIALGFSPGHRNEINFIKRCLAQILLVHFIFRQTFKGNPPYLKIKIIHPIYCESPPSLSPSPCFYFFTGCDKTQFENLPSQSDFEDSPSSLGWENYSVRYFPIKGELPMWKGRDNIIPGSPAMRGCGVWWQSDIAAAGSRTAGLKNGP